MNHRVILIIATAGFVSGLVVGHYASPREFKIISSSATNKPGATVSISAQKDANPHPNILDIAASASPDKMIVAIQNAAAHPANHQLYSELSELINALDPQNVRPVVDAVQRLPGQRE